MNKLLIAFFILPALLMALPGYGQSYGSAPADSFNVTEAAQPQGKTLVFLFLPEDDMFYIPFQGNGDRLDELVATVDHYKKLITDGTVKINVAGYSSALATRTENLNSAVVRANRVKSELILRNGIKEENFATTVHAKKFEGRKSVVVVTLRVPQIEPPRAEQPKPEPKPQPRPEPKPEPKPEPVVEAQPEPVAIPEPADPWREPYRFAVRTNLLYDAFLLPTLGVEWRVNRDIGIKLDGSLAWWGNKSGKIQRIWLVNPEVRWYMGGAKRFYVGLGGNYGEYNTYGYLLGKLYPDNTGYQGKLWGGGLTVGYQARLARHLLLDLNLGLGVTRLEYDTFYMQDGIRTYDKKDQTKNFWGPTQAGVSLVWTFGRNK